MSLTKQLQSTEISPRTALFSVVALLAVSAGVIVGIVKFAGGTSGETADHPTRQSIRHSSSPTAKAETTGEDRGADDARSYDVIVSRNIFRSPATGQTITAQPAGTSASAAVPTPPPSKTNTPPPPPSQRDNTPHRARPRIACTGIVNIDGVTYALLENLDLQRAQYTALNGMAFGYQLIDIRAQSVTLAANGETVMLRVGENKSEEVTAPANGEATESKEPTDVKPDAAPGDGGNAPGDARPGMPPGGMMFNRQGSPRRRATREG